MTPHGCRLRDLTYAGRIVVDVKYVMDRRVVTAKNVPIGLMPLMLRSSKCVLRDKGRAEMAKVGSLRLWQRVRERGRPSPERMHTHESTRLVCIAPAVTLHPT